MAEPGGPPASALKRASLFIAIGAILFLLFEWYGPYQPGRGYRPRPIERIGADGTTLERAFDGHFHVSGRIGRGRAGPDGDAPTDAALDVAFLVDTGASTVAIGEALAARLDHDHCRPNRYATAAGTVEGCETVVPFVEVAGLRIPDVRVAVLPGLDGALLGMNVLRHFRIEQHGGRMVLTAAQRTEGSR